MVESLSGKVVETLPTPGTGGSNPIKIHLEQQHKLSLASIEVLAHRILIAHREDTPVLATDQMIDKVYAKYKVAAEALEKAKYDELI